MTLDGGEDFMASEASRKRKKETKKFKWERMKYKRTNREEWKVQIRKQRRKKHKRSNKYLKSRRRKKSLNKENRNTKDQMKRTKFKSSNGLKQCLDE